MKTIIRMSACIVLTFTLQSCGGGGSTSPAPVAIDPPPPPVATTATVAITLTDMSADDYDHAFATITSVDLIGDGGHREIFSGEETVDLLALKDTVQLFAVDENVEPGVFSKIRIIASGLTLAVDNGDGTTTDTDVELVANGKIDLNPREEVSIEAGDVVFVSVDWDMNESLKLTETGNGRIIMRPVVFVEIGTEPAFKAGLIRVTGAVELISSDFTVFRLCPLNDGDQPSVDPVLNSLCLDIAVNEKTGLFGEDGSPITVDQLVIGELATVIGVLRRSMDAPAVSPLEEDGAEVNPTPYQIGAIVVEAGDPANWQQLRGMLESEVDATTNDFDFLLDNGQGFPDDSVMTGHLEMKSRIFMVSPDTGVNEIAAADLVSGDRAGVDAVHVPADDAADPDILRIAAMIARTPGDTDVEALIGEILSIDSAVGTLMVATASMDRCITTDDETKIFKVVVTDDAVENMPAMLDELAVGSKVFLAGADDGSGCFAADLIIAEGQVTAP
jgi:hypothetical protein